MKESNFLGALLPSHPDLVPIIEAMREKYHLVHQVFWERKKEFHQIGEFLSSLSIDSNLVEGKINAYAQFLVTESKLPWPVPNWVFRTDW